MERPAGGTKAPGAFVSPNREPPLAKRGGGTKAPGSFVPPQSASIYRVRCNWWARVPFGIGGFGGANNPPESGCHTGTRAARSVRGDEGIPVSYGMPGTVAYCFCAPVSAYFAESSRRLAQPVFFSRLRTWNFTVLSDTKSSPAISELVRPFSTRRKTSRSRAERS